jgi:hypothetical protein
MDPLVSINELQGQYRKIQDYTIIIIITTTTTNNIVLQADISVCTGPVIVYCPKGAAQTFVTK